MPSGKQSRRRRREQALKAPPPVGKRSSLLPDLSPRTWAALAGIAAAIIGGIVAAVVVSSGGHSATTLPIAQSQLTGLITQKGSWGANSDTLSYRLHEIGLPALGQEGSVLHIHQHLDLFVDGKRLPLPAGIGVDPNGSFISPLHTHDAAGVVHVESPTDEKFTLAQLFAVWGVKLTPNCLGGYCNQPVRIYVKGKRVGNSAADVVLAPHDEIAVVVGKRPPHIPESYRFSAGE